MNKTLLPGWDLKIDEFSPGAYRITMTDEDGRKAEVVDDYNDSTLEKCSSYAFDIERQVKRNWNKFLFNLGCLQISDLEIEKKEYLETTFGSWIIQTKDKRILLDGKDGWLIYGQKQSGDWVDKEIIEEFKQVTFEKFKSFINKLM